MARDTIGTTAQVAAACGVTPAVVRWIVSQHPELDRYGTKGRRQYDVLQIRDILAARPVVDVVTSANA